MASGFAAVLRASEADRRELFITTASRLAISVENVERDFWVCWVLDLLFNAGAPDEPRLLLTGATSLSKSYGLIARLSEGIDLAVCLSDQGQAADVERMASLRGKKQREQLNAIRHAGQYYIATTLRARLTVSVAHLYDSARLKFNESTVVLDPSDAERQTLLIRYPTVQHRDGLYLPPSIKIEARATPALAPHRATTLRPCVAEDARALALDVNDVPTLHAGRTFWDKVVILHGVRRWFERRGELRRRGERVSRHYYDVYRLLQHDVGRAAAGDLALANDSVRHARLFFDHRDLDLKSAEPGAFALTPLPGMEALLRSDYVAMAGMIVGPVPAWESVVDAISRLESQINRAAAG